MKKKDTPLPPGALNEVLDRDAAERRHRRAAERLEKDAALRHAIEARNEIVIEDDKKRLGLDKRDAEALFAAVEREVLPASAHARDAMPTAPRLVTPSRTEDPVEAPALPNRRNHGLVALGVVAAVSAVIALFLIFRDDDVEATVLPAGSPTAASATSGAMAPTQKPIPPTAPVTATVSTPPEPTVVPSTERSAKPSAASSKPTAKPNEGSVFDPNAWKFKK